MLIGLFWNVGICFPYCSKKHQYGDCSKALVSLAKTVQVDEVHLVAWTSRQDSDSCQAKAQAMPSIVLPPHEDCAIIVCSYQL